MNTSRSRESSESVDLPTNLKDEDIPTDGGLLYRLTQVPPISILMTGAIQHLVMNLAMGVVVANMVADTLCSSYDSPTRTTLFSSILFLNGVCIILQTGLGVRLPIYQGPSGSFFPTLLAIRNNPEWACPEDNLTRVFTPGNVTASGIDLKLSLSVLSENERLQQLSGSLMVASCLEICVGATGLIALFMRFIGPLTVATTISLISISMYKIHIIQSTPSWEVALVGTVLAVVFILYIPNLRVPLPVCTRNKDRSYVRPCYLFPALLNILIMWGISAILTVTDVIPDDRSTLRYRARTDARSSLVGQSPWFILPYPGQFGIPSFNSALFVGFSTGFFASMIESVGDYFAAANACCVDPPPNHAVNRGILMEGIGGLLCGAVGIAHATTSYSPNIPTLTISKIASRSVMLCCGVLLMVLGVLGKFGAAVASIPDPAMAGVSILLSGMVISLGMANLRHVNMKSSRNLSIFGISIITGIFMSEWMGRHPDLINTGVPQVDGVITVTLGSSMFVGCLLSVLLDNTVKGSLEDRGIISWRVCIAALPDGQGSVQDSYISASEAYEWQFLRKTFERFPCMRRLPFLPPLHRSSTDSDKLHGRLEGDHDEMAMPIDDRI